MGREVQEREDDIEEMEDKKAPREEGELSDEDEEDDEVFTLHCRRCSFRGSSRKELDRHRAWHHWEKKRESQSPRPSRYSSSVSSYQRYSGSEMKYQPRYR